MDLQLSGKRVGDHMHCRNRISGLDARPGGVSVVINRPGLTRVLSGPTTRTVYEIPDASIPVVDGESEGRRMQFIVA